MGQTDLWVVRSSQKPWLDCPSLLGRIRLKLFDIIIWIRVADPAAKRQNREGEVDADCAPSAVQATQRFLYVAPIQYTFY